MIFIIMTTKENDDCCECKLTTELLENIPNNEELEEMYNKKELNFVRQLVTDSSWPLISHKP